MDPVARKVLGIIAVIVGIVLAVIGMLENNPQHFHTAVDLVAGGVIADAVGVGVLVF